MNTITSLRSAAPIKLAAALALATAVLATSACNTTAGVGRDLKKAGNKIESTARRNS